MGPYLENKVVGTGQLLYHTEKYPYICDFVQIDVIMKKFNNLKYILQTSFFFQRIIPVE